MSIVLALDDIGRVTWKQGTQGADPGILRPGENAFRRQAGAQGLEALILNFPQVRSRLAEAPKPSVGAGLKKWQCVLCNFAYDEAIGMPDDGIPAGTGWQDVPDSWSCPDCAACKSDFQMLEV